MPILSLTDAEMVLLKRLLERERRTPQNRQVYDSPMGPLPPGTCLLVKNETTYPIDPLTETTGTGADDFDIAGYRATMTVYRVVFDGSYYELQPHPNFTVPVLNLDGVHIPDDTYMIVQYLAIGYWVVTRSFGFGACMATANENVSPSDTAYDVNNVDVMFGRNPVSDAADILSVKNTFSDYIDQYDKVGIIWNGAYAGQWETWPITCSTR